MTTSALLAALLVGSFFHVNLGPEIKPPVSYDLPPAYIMEASKDTLSSAVISKDQYILSSTPWWKEFNEPVLDKCIEEAFRSNRDLEMALARVQQARSAFKETKANQRPELGAQLDVTRSKILGNADGNINETNVLTGLGVVNYEADLWGKLQKGTRAAKENLLATEAAKNSVRLSLASQVAKTYFSLRGADKQLLIAKTTLQSQLATLELMRLRYQHGKVSELDLRRSEALAASSAVQTRELEMTVSRYENALLVLLGREPKEFINKDIPRGVDLGELPKNPEIPNAVPALTITQRPDIKQAEQNYKVALANIGSARAGQYPSISFSGMIGTPSDDPSNLLTGPTGWSIGSQLFAPIFNSGKLSSRVKKAEAVAQEAWAQYYKTVQISFQETVNAFTSKEKTSDVVTLLAKQEEAQARAYKLAYDQYQEGMTSQIELLDAERQLLSVRLQLEGSRADNLNSTVDLCTALGGGWSWRAADDAEKRELPKPWADKKKFSE